MTRHGSPAQPLGNPTTRDTEPPVTQRSLALTQAPAARALQELALTHGWETGLEALELIAQNDSQQVMVDWINRYQPAIPHLRGMTSMASGRADVLNSFLQAHGFEPLFTPFPERDIGITSIVKAPVVWPNGGEVTSIVRFEAAKGYRKYPAYKLTGSGARREMLIGGPGQLTDRVVLETKNGYTFYLAMLPEDADCPRNGAELLNLTEQMLYTPTRAMPTRAGVTLPKISFDRVATIPWLNGLEIRTPLGDWRLSECMQHTKLYMNEIGALMEAAFAGRVTRGGDDHAEQPYEISRHFVLAVVDGKTSTTVYYLHPEDSWGEPPAGIIEAALK